MAQVPDRFGGLPAWVLAGWFLQAGMALCVDHCKRKGSKGSVEGSRLTWFVCVCVVEMGLFAACCIFLQECFVEVQLLCSKHMWWRCPVQDRAALYQPKSLDDKTREHVQRAVRIRKALPAFKVDRRTEKKPLAPSGQKSAFKDWLGSEEGKQWASDRARIWAPPELGAEDDAS